jgi:hypothetical protein
MKVKNGIASNVSLFMIPNTRSGSAWRKLGSNSPSSIPIRPKNSPLAASANATG